MVLVKWADPSELAVGSDYPRTLSELVAMFPDDAAVAQFIERLRWPDGFACRSCGVMGTEPWRSSARPGVLVCRECGSHSRVTAGTVLEGTRTPLVVWAQAAWLFATAKNGVSAKTVERTLGVSSQGSRVVAWGLLGRLRVAATRQPRPRLSGVVEADETLIGGAREGGARGRGSPDKAIVAMACECPDDEPRFGRLRMRLIPKASREHLLPFIRDVVEPGSLIRADGHPAYRGVTSHGYGLEQFAVSGSGQRAHNLLPAVHRAASLLKRLLLGTYQGGVAHEHLPVYLEEFTFRWNRRSSEERGLLFYRIWEQATATEAVTREELRYGFWRPDWTDTVGRGDLHVLYVPSADPDDRAGTARTRGALERHPRLRVTTLTDPLAARQHAGLVRPDVVVIDSAHLGRRPRLPHALAGAAKGASIVLHDPRNLTSQRTAREAGARRYSSASHDNHRNLLRAILNM